MTLETGETGHTITLEACGNRPNNHTRDRWNRPHNDNRDRLVNRTHNAH